MIFEEVQSALSERNRLRKTFSRWNRL